MDLNNQRNRFLAVSHVWILIKRERDKKAILIKVRLILSFSLSLGWRSNRKTVAVTRYVYVLSENDKKDVRPKQPNDELSFEQRQKRALLCCNCNYFRHSELKIASFHLDNFILYERFFSGRDDAIYFQEFQINRFWQA